MRKRREESEKNLSGVTFLPLQDLFVGKCRLGTLVLGLAAGAGSGLVQRCCGERKSEKTSKTSPGRNGTGCYMSCCKTRMHGSLKSHEKIIDGGK